MSAKAENLPPRPDVEGLLALAKRVDEVVKKPQPPLPNMESQQHRNKILSEFRAERIDVFIEFLQASGYETVSALCQYILDLEANFGHSDPSGSDGEVARDITRRIGPSRAVECCLAGITHGRTLERKSAVSWLRRQGEDAQRMVKACPFPLNNALRQEIQHNADAFYDVADRLEAGAHWEK